MIVSLRILIITTFPERSVIEPKMEIKSPKTINQAGVPLAVVIRNMGGGVADGYARLGHEHGGGAVDVELFQCFESWHFEQSCRVHHSVLLGLLLLTTISWIQSADKALAELDRQVAAGLAALVALRVGYDHIRRSCREQLRSCMTMYAVLLAAASNAYEMWTMVSLHRAGGELTLDRWLSLETSNILTVGSLGPIFAIMFALSPRAFAAITISAVPTSVVVVLSAPAERLDEERAQSIVGLCLGYVFAYAIGCGLYFYFDNQNRHLYATMKARRPRPTTRTYRCCRHQGRRAAACRRSAIWRMQRAGTSPPSRMTSARPSRCCACSSLSSKVMRS